MGESTADYLMHATRPSIATVLGVLLLGIALIAQFLVRRYVAWTYWFAVLCVAVFGTMAADDVHTVGVPYIVSTLTFLVALVVVFEAWYRTEGTLSIHSITSVSREIFYWATVMATFALGTAAGDMSAKSLGLGYLVSAAAFTLLIATPGLAYRMFGLNSVIAFWIAYVLTRPIGASFADWVGKARSSGGLGLGDGIVSIVLGIIITALVAYLARTRVDITEECPE